MQQQHLLPVLILRRFDSSHVDLPIHEGLVGVQGEGSNGACTNKLIWYSIT